MEPQADTDTATKRQIPGPNMPDLVRSFVERAERLEAEKKVIADDLSDLFAEAKGNKVDVKALKHVLKLRKQDAAEWSEHERTVDQYLHALGMLPLFQHQEAAE